ncbi:hypothetical protein GCM10009037_07140 [Halarchaeum grantii]|uniref:Uncharacterized protein n=1 Tax=Halarchaeum grantii TaxID=1193105 RepID=A0A830ESU0_9EURY|nr:hypothetical protein [Halarchaeum grantii]GGL26092.1 hypothetical protein GCM10009037_07140 [Halarchaeum grantii]
MNWKKTLTHPASVVAGALGVVGIAVKPTVITAVFAAVWAQAGTIFTATSLTAFSIVPNLPSLAGFQPVAIGVALVSGAVYLVKLGDRVIDEFERRL